MLIPSCTMIASRRQSVLEVTPASLGLATTYLARRRDAAGCVQTQRLQQANETSKQSSMRSAVEWHETT